MHFPSVINLIDLFMALSFKNSVRLREMTTLLNKRLVATECHIEQTRRHRCKSSWLETYIKMISRMC